MKFSFPLLVTAGCMTILSCIEGSIREELGPKELNATQNNEDLNKEGVSVTQGVAAVDELIKNKLNSTQAVKVVNELIKNKLNLKEDVNELITKKLNMTLGAGIANATVKQLVMKALNTSQISEQQRATAEALLSNGVPVAMLPKVLKKAMGSMAKLKEKRRKKQSAEKCGVQNAENTTDKKPDNGEKLKDGSGNEQNKCADKDDDNRLWQEFDDNMKNMFDNDRGITNLLKKTLPRILST